MEVEEYYLRNCLRSSASGKTASRRRYPTTLRHSGSWIECLRRESSCCIMICVVASVSLFKAWATVRPGFRVAILLMKFCAHHHGRKRQSKLVLIQNVAFDDISLLNRIPAAPVLHQSCHFEHTCPSAEELPKGQAAANEMPELHCYFYVSQGPYLLLP